MKKTFLSLSAACLLVTSAVTAPAMAQPTTGDGLLVTTTDEAAGSTANSASTNAAGSSDAEIAGLVVGSVALTLAAAGGAAYFAIQQGLIQNPLPGVIPGPRAPKPAPKPAPRPAPTYQSFCSESQALQPARGADGKWLVCVGMGQGNFRWVYGPTPQGVGTASQGAYCRTGEEGGQDSRGRIMMCLNNQWIYGP